MLSCSHYEDIVALSYRKISTKFHKTMVQTAQKESPQDDGSDCSKKVPRGSFWAFELCAEMPWFCQVRHEPIQWLPAGTRGEMHPGFRFQFAWFLKCKHTSDSHVKYTLLRSFSLVRLMSWKMLLLAWMWLQVGEWTFFVCFKGSRLLGDESEAWDRVHIQYVDPFSTRSFASMQRSERIFVWNPRRGQVQRARRHFTRTGGRVCSPGNERSSYPPPLLNVVKSHNHQLIRTFVTVSSSVCWHDKRFPGNPVTVPSQMPGLQGLSAYANDRWWWCLCKTCTQRPTNYPN